MDPKASEISMAGTIADNVQINVHYLTRVEGHGNIVVNVNNGVLEQCDLEIIEAPRYFEAMLRGQPYTQAPRLASRICGICAVAHSTTSTRSVERALGIKPSQQTILLRKLGYQGEMLDSHILHVYMLVAPDLFGVGSVIPLAQSSPEIVNRALRMKKMAGDICAVVYGRHTHPIAMTVGGFTHFPSVMELEALMASLEAIRPDIEATVELFQSLKLPDFERETEFIALHKDDEYCLIDGEIVSSDGGSWPLEQYKQVTNEFLVSHSTAKHARNQRQSYMVGALARFNLNHKQLQPHARAAAAALSLSPVCTNPYFNTVAQLVEIVHCYEEAIGIIGQLLENGVYPEEPVKPGRYSGEGVGACEAPRGTLYHHYLINNGYVAEANCVIPTGQNLANIEADMRALVPKLLNRTPEEITKSLEMLVRAYDPCISCSAHMLEVSFV
jgi:sulfhydrogenase subunit alpha